VFKTRFRRWAALFVLAAYFYIVFPYARALLWLHGEPSSPSSLVLPVDGIRREQLNQSFRAPRAHGPHEGIDIAAAAGTPVRAAADGIIVGNRTTKVGGIVLWVLGSGRRLYYYAHLQQLAPGMRMGRRVAAGEQIGAVGNTGNAAKTIPHLHFAIYLVANDFFPLDIGPMDPYAVLQREVPASPQSIAGTRQSG